MITFRSRGRTFEPAAFAHPPFFHMLWPQDIVGLRLDSRTDWDEVRELITVSYAVLDAISVEAVGRSGQTVPARLVGIDFESGLGVVKLLGPGPWPAATCR